MTDIHDVQTHSYDDRGDVTAETVIDLGEKQIVVVESEGKDEHDVWLQFPDENKPKEEWNRHRLGQSLA